MNQWDEMRSKPPFKGNKENKWVQMSKTEMWG